MGVRGFWLVFCGLTALLVSAVLGAAPEATQPASDSCARPAVSPGSWSAPRAAPMAGRAAADPGHPVSGATVHLVPVTAIDTTTPMTASAIYAAPFPAEAYDEPLEDAIRRRRHGISAGDHRRPGPLRHRDRARRHLLPPRHARGERPRTPAGRRPEPPQLRRRRAARHVDDDRGVEQSARVGPLHRQFRVPGLPRRQAALAADRAQAGVDGAGRARAAAGFRPAPRILQRPRPPSRRWTTTGGARGSSWATTTPAATTTSSRSAPSATRGCRSTRRMPTSTCGGDPATAST